MELITLASHHGGAGGGLRLRLWVSGILPSVCEALVPSPALRKQD